MEKRIQIRDLKLSKKPRVFDVIVDEKGEILRYEMQNIRGWRSIEGKDIKNQIDKALSEKVI